MRKRQKLYRYVLSAPLLEMPEMPNPTVVLLVAHGLGNADQMMTQTPSTLGVKAIKLVLNPAKNYVRLRLLHEMTHGHTHQCPTTKIRGLV